MISQGVFFGWGDLIISKKNIWLAIGAALVVILIANLYIYSYPFIIISKGYFYGILCFVILLFLIFLHFNKSKITSIRILNIFNFLLILLFLLVCFLFFDNRPVLLVFEYDRFRVVHHSDLSKADFGILSSTIFSKKKWLAKASLRPFRDGDEQYLLLFKALNGYPLGFNSQLWQEYEKSDFLVIEEAKKWKNSKKLKEYFFKFGYVEKKNYGYLPVIGKDIYWTAKINLDTAEIIGFYPVDPYD